jgi:hypothetical protein
MPAAVTEPSAVTPAILKNLRRSIGEFVSFPDFYQP